MTDIPRKLYDKRKDFFNKGVIAFYAKILVYMVFARQSGRMLSLDLCDRAHRKNAGNGYCPGKGKKTLEQLLAGNQYQAIHIMLGINELGYEMDQLLRQYESVVEAIQEMEPDAKIILGANLHVTAENAANSAIYNNDNINILNGEIQKIGEMLDCHYIDVNVLFDDPDGNLSAEYSTDGFHILAYHIVF